MNFCMDPQVRATDEDSGLNGQITYSFINDLGKTQFIIDADGVISTVERLDRENPLYKDMVLTVMALDGGGTVYTNQNVFHIKASSDQLMGRPNILVTAMYYIVILYWLYCGYKHILYYLYNVLFVFVLYYILYCIIFCIVLYYVYFFFSGRASFCTVRVVLADENDNAPQFRAVEYRLSIKANVAKGSLVTQIQATDPDAGSNGRITYSLYSEARLSLVDVLEVSEVN